MLDSHGRWIPDLIPKGYVVFNNTSRYLLVDGPRKSGKTLSILHKVVRHAYENPGGRIGIIVQTIRNAKSGTWSDLNDITIPEWIAGGLEHGTRFKVTREQKMDPATKMSSVWVSTYNGGECEIQLHSIDNGDNPAKKFKSTRFSMVYLAEADLWEDREIFNILAMQLRNIHVPRERQQMIIDCNPPENGPEHWLYNLFFEEKNPARERIQIVLDDNTKLDPLDKQELIELYQHDQNKYNRWVLGIWERDHSGCLFKDVFDPNVHIRGHSRGPEDDWEIIVPPENCIHLHTGWDLGDTNHAAGILCKRDISDNTEAAWDLIDEVVYLHKRVSIADFSEIFMNRMDFWEEFMLEHYGCQKVLWTHWSDETALTRFRAAANSFDHLIVSQATGGRIQLRAADKLPGSMKIRLSLVKKLLFSKRLFVSARCRYAIDMFQKLPPGKAAGEAIDRYSEHKHSFDWVSYPLAMECPRDLRQKTQPKTSRMVTVPT